MKIKRLLALALVAVLAVAVFAIPVAAMYYIPSSCPACSGSSNIGLWEDTTWATYSSGDCTHGYNGRDFYQKNTGTLKCYDDATTFKGAKYRTYCTLGEKVY